MEDKKLKKRLKKIPDADTNGEPIYKIDVDSSKTMLDETLKVGINKENKSGHFNKKK